MKFKKQQKGISTTLNVLLIILLIVIIGGGIVYKYYLAPRGELPIGELEGPQNETAGWKVYKNEEYGFEIKCPINWHKRAYMKEDYSEEGSNNYWLHFCTHLDSKNECSCATVINSHGEIEEECAIITGYFHKCKSTKLEESLVDRISNFPIEDRPQEGWEWVEIGGTRAIKAYSIRYLDINYFIPTEDGYIYQIDLETSCPKGTQKECENKYELILDQILSTFKFEEKSQDETADWKIYRNEEYGFEIKYPKSWELLNNNPYSKILDFSFRDKKYDGSFEWPGLRIIDKDVASEFSDVKILSRVFRKEEAENEVIRIYFDESGRKLYATCTFYLEPIVIESCNQILSTFKFVERSQDEATDWKIYRNEEYGLEFEYPANWIYFEKEEENEEVRNNFGWVYYIKLKPKDKEYFYEGAEEYLVNIRILNKNKWDKVDGDVDLIIDNIPATKFITKMGEYTAWELTATQEPNSKNYYFEFFNPIYVLSNDTELDNLLEIFDKIFSSFKFLK